MTMAFTGCHKTNFSSDPDTMRRVSDTSTVILTRQMATNDTDTIMVTRRSHFCTVGKEGSVMLRKCFANQAENFSSGREPKLMLAFWKYAWSAWVSTVHAPDAGGGVEK